MGRAIMLNKLVYGVSFCGIRASFGVEMTFAPMILLSEPSERVWTASRPLLRTYTFRTIACIYDLP